MNADEYTKMFQLEDRYWWFVGRRRLALGMLKAAFRASGTIECPPVIVDLGCGTGVVLGELETWSTPIGLDMSSLALSYCSQRGIKRLVQADGTHLPFADGSLDAVLGLDIFEHIEDDTKAFSEAHRVLKPGGVLVLSVPAFQFLWGPHDIALMHFRRYRRPQLKKLLESAGLEVQRVTYSVFFLFPLIVLYRIFEKRRPGPAKASLVAVPSWLNRALIWLQMLEANVISWTNLPIGSSVVAVARKPES